MKLIWSGSSSCWGKSKRSAPRFSPTQLAVMGNLLDCTFERLTPALVREEIERLKLISSGVPEDDWDLAEYLYQLPGKWELSTLVRYRGSAAAFTLVSKKVTTVHLHRIAVESRLQGQGVGRRLMASLERDAQDCGYSRTSLKCHRNNLDAIRFYERLGYQIAAQDPSVYHLLTKKIK